MTKNLLYTAFGLMGLMGTLVIGVADASIYSVIRSNQSAGITITYNANGGVFSGDLTTKSVVYIKNANDLYMASGNVQAPDRDGYMFAGWYLQQGDATSQTTEWYGIPTDTTETTKTVYAKWLPYTNKTVDLGEIGSFDIMDRNMGAEDVSDGLYNNKTANQLGYYYQWGNNYGFKNSGSVPYSVTTQIDITGKGYGPGNYYSSATFVKRTSSPYRKWDTDTSSTTYTSYGNLNLWGGENTSNPDSWRQGPCPENYHVPDTLEWKAAYELFKSWAKTTAGQEYCATFTDDNTTYRPKCFASKLALPFAGYRYNDASYGYDQGANGNYWSSSPYPSSANYSYYLYFYSSYVGPQDRDYRDRGFSVRCFKNSSTQALTFSRNGEIIDTKNVRRWEPITTSYKPANPSGTTENWYTDSELTSQFTFGNTTYVTEAKTLYSKITCNNSSYIWNGTECVQQFTVTLNATANGGTITPTSVTVANGSQFPLENYIASKDGYTFEGWAETSGTTGVLTQNPTITANKTLYAVFKKNITITYLSGLGVNTIGRDSDTCEIYNNNVNCTIYSPSITLKAGYGTGKWINGKKIVDPGEILTLTGDDTYTAIATPNLDTQYIVNYYQENLSGIYDIVEIYTGVGTTDTQATAEQKIYSGFTFSGNYSENIITGNINGSGYLVLKLYYDRDSYVISFISDDAIIQSGSLKYGATILIPANPTKNGYKFVSWNKEIPTTMPAENLTIKAVWEKNGYSGGGGRSSRTSDTQDSSTSSQNDKNTENVIQSDPEHSEWGSEESSKTPMDSSDKSSEGQNQQQFTQEFQEAYEFAHENGITTKNTIESADMNGKLTRIAMAKMLSQYAMNVLGQKPANIVTPKFNDVTDKQNSDYDDGVTLAYQLGIMGQNMPGNNFRPDDEVTRAEFATALSRMLYHTSDGEYKSTDKYYTNHMKKLVQEKIITNDDAKMKELRGYVMIMLMRSAK